MEGLLIVTSRRCQLRLRAVAAAADSHADIDDGIVSRHRPATAAA